jgi:asparagine synthase (glutamine-hydrolysing)
MSAIGGIYNFDGAPVDRSFLNDLTCELEQFGPDGVEEYSALSIGMVYGAFHTTPQSKLEKQPYVSEGNVVLCWDGRLDNRAELVGALNLPLNSDTTDVAIVMAAYRRWGLEFLDHVVADFALSLWDSRSKTLLLARDIIGSRDLFYHATLHSIVWCSDLETLIDLTKCDLNVDENYVAAHLARLPESNQTPFKDIHAVGAAHVVTVKEGLIRPHRYWKLQPGREIRYRSDSEYEEHFRDLFRESVRTRLRAIGPVWSDLSGGLDSSSIVCMAHELVRSGEADVDGFETVSYIHDEAPTSTEIKFIKQVEEYTGKVGHHLLESEFPILPVESYRSSIIPNTLDIFRPYYDELDKRIAESGARVRLCGNGGDEILNSIPNPSADLCDLFVEGRFLQLHRRLKIWSRDRKQPYVKLFWEGALLPILPRRILVTLKHGPVKRLPNWLDDGFVRRTNFPDLLLGTSDVFGFHRPSDRQQAISFLCAVREQAAGYMRRLQKSEIRLPFLHRPLIEFMHAIPHEQRARPGETRSLQRRALKGLVPEEILRRKGKGNPVEALSRALVREHEQLRQVLQNSSVARYGYVNQEALMASFGRLRYGDMRSLEIFRTIPLEFWLRRLEQRQSRTKINAASMGLPQALPAAAC